MIDFNQVNVLTVKFIKLIAWIVFINSPNAKLDFVRSVFLTCNKLKIKNIEFF